MTARMVLLLMLFSSSLRAAVSPASLPTPTLRQNLASALSVPVTQIVEVKAVSLGDAGPVSGLVLGRYRTGTQAWSFPVLAVYYACETGTCQSILRLGQASERLAALAVVDLDAPLARLGSLQPSWIVAAPRQLATAARWPVLLLASEAQSRQPTEAGPGARAMVAAGPSEVELSVISLKSPASPTLLHRRSLSERWPEPSDPRGMARPPRRIGRQIESLSLGRKGDERLLVVVEHDIDSQFSRGLRPQPETQTLRLVGERFEAVSSPRPSQPEE